MNMKEFNEVIGLLVRAREAGRAPTMDEARQAEEAMAEIYADARSCQEDESCEDCGADLPAWTSPVVFQAIQFHDKCPNAACDDCGLVGDHTLGCSVQDGE